MRVDIETACKLLETGNVVGLPTETVYGLAASIHYPDAIESIFRLKGRPRNNPLIVHVSSVEEILQYAHLPPEANTLANAFWPGPLTLVLKVIPNKVPEIIRAGLSTAAFRIPSHPSTLEVIRRVGPLVMPSANISGKPSSTSAEHVEQDFGFDFAVLDGGSCQSGLESTIMMQQEEKWVLLRQGALPAEFIEDVIGYLPLAVKSTADKPICPGQLYRHYAPIAQLILSDRNFEEIEGNVIGFSNRTYPKAERVFSLGSDQLPEEAANNLYKILRELDSEQVKIATVDMQMPEVGLWRAIRDRLIRAAQK